MSRFRSASSYGHSAIHLGGSDYRLGWTVDFYYSGHRSRFPRRFHRDTDEAGMNRFCKRWDIPVAKPQIQKA